MEVKALQQMITQFRQMQETMQRQIDTLQVEASAGGGMVVVKMNGQKIVTDVKIEPSVFAGKDQEMLQELIRSAVNDASRRIDEALADQMQNLAGGMPAIGNLLKIPGLF